jgi:hypothetical protein
MPKKHDDEEPYRPGMIVVIQTAKRIVASEAQLVFPVDIIKGFMIGWILIILPQSPSFQHVKRACHYETLNNSHLPVQVALKTYPALSDNQSPLQAPGTSRLKGSPCIRTALNSTGDHQ